MAGAAPTSTTAIAAVLVALLSSLLAQPARAAAAVPPCARALYAPAVAHAGSAFWAVAQFDGAGPNLAAACAASGANESACGLFAAPLPAIVPGSLQAYPSIVRAAVVRVMVRMPADDFRVVLALAPLSCEPSTPPAPAPLSVSVAAVSAMPRAPRLTLVRAPTVVTATFDVRLDFFERVSWLDPSAVRVNATTTSPGRAPTNPATLTSEMAAAAGARVAMVVRPSSEGGGDGDAGAGAALVLTVDGATPGQTVGLQVPAGAFAGAAQSPAAANSSVLIVRVPSAGSTLLPGLALLSGRLLPGVVGVSAGVCLAAALIAPGTHVATVTCGSANLLRSVGHAQVACALGSALSSPTLGLAPSVAAAASGLRWSMLQWLPPAFNGPLATYLANWAVRVEDAREEARARRRAGVMGALAAGAFEREAEARRNSATLAAVTQSGMWREIIGANPLRMIASDGRVRDFQQEGQEGEPAAPEDVPAALAAGSALADRDTASALDSWLRDMQLGGGAAVSVADAAAAATRPTSGSGFLSYVVATPEAVGLAVTPPSLPLPPALAAANGTNATLQQDLLEAHRSSFVAPRALLSRRPLSGAAWVLEPEKGRRKAALAAAWIAFLGAAEVGGVAMFAALLLHVAAAAVDTKGPQAQDHASESSSSPPPSRVPSRSSPPVRPVPAILPAPPRLLASLAVRDGSGGGGMGGSGMGGGMGGGGMGGSMGGGMSNGGGSLAQRAIRNSVLAHGTWPMPPPPLPLPMLQPPSSRSIFGHNNGGGGGGDEAPLLHSPPLFAWPKLAIMGGVVAWPPLVHLASGLLPGGAPAWMVAAVAGPLVLLGGAVFVWMLLWASGAGAEGLLRPVRAADVQATCQILAAQEREEQQRQEQQQQQEQEDDDATRCRELEAEDRDDDRQQRAQEQREREEQQQQQQQRRHLSLLRPPVPSTSPALRADFKIDVGHVGRPHGFADRVPTGQRLRAALRAPLSPSPPSSPPAPPAPREPLPSAERLIACVPPIYYVPPSAGGGGSGSSMAVTVLRPVLLPRSGAGGASGADGQGTHTPSPLPSRSPALRLLGGSGSGGGGASSRPRHLGGGGGNGEIREIGGGDGGGSDDGAGDDDGVDDALLASIASAAAASAQWVRSTGIVSPAPPPAGLAYMLRARQAEEEEEDARDAAARRASARAADALERARLNAYAGAAGLLLADIVGPVVMPPAAAAAGPDDPERNERALLSRAAPAMLGANALAFLGTLLICGLCGLLGAVSAPPPLDAAARASTSVVSLGAAAGSLASPRAVAAGVTSVVWALLALRILWAAVATQAYASASAAALEALCSACETGLLVVAAVALPLLQSPSGGGGGPGAAASLSVAALLLLLVEMIVLTAVEIVRTFVVIGNAGGLACLPSAVFRGGVGHARRGLGGNWAASRLARTSRVAPSGPPLRPQSSLARIDRAPSRARA